ncbi:MAG: cupin-like domain-containing protein [Myxococcales bacterium]|nr:cupin-like domain-containing protein [Myxococcales bacterium]
MSRRRSRRRSHRRNRRRSALAHVAHPRARTRMSRTKRKKRSSSSSSSSGSKKRRSSKAARASPRLREEIGLSDPFRDWLVHNLLRGVRPERLVEQLAQQAEVPREIAAREVDAMVSSPLLPMVTRYARWSRSLELVLELERKRQRGAAAIDRLATVDAETFYTRYYRAGRPLLLDDATRSWPALERWTPAYFAESLGDVELDVCVGRAADPTPDLNFAQHTQRMRVADFVARVLEAGESNDLYLIANNHAMKRDELAVLLDDIVIDTSIFDASKVRGASSLWLGPAGTITPLHHDTSNIFFCQIYGRKRVRLAPPGDIPLLRRLRGFYVGLDEGQDAERALDAAPDDQGPLAGARVVSVDLAPGDTLFIPAGWFHHVRALDVSISFSLLCFRQPNRFDWYTPGAPAL